MKQFRRVLPQSAFEDFDKWVACGAAFPAIASLGKALRNALNEERVRLLEQVRCRAQPYLLHDAAVEAAASWGRAMRIVSIGTKFDEDEILLVLTLQLQIELVLEVLTVIGFEGDEIDVTKIDAELRDIASSRENRRSFANAFGMLERNCGIPVKNRWMK